MCSMSSRYKIYQTIPNSLKYKYKYWGSSDPGCYVLKGKNAFPVSFIERDAAWISLPPSTSQSQILSVDPARSKQQKELLRGSSCQTLDETLWASRRVTNRFWVCYPAPCEWQPTSKKGVEKEDKLSGAHIKQMKNEMTKEGKHP